MTMENLNKLTMKKINNEQKGSNSSSYGPRR